MTDSSKSTGLGWVFWSFLWGCVGYFIYGNLTGALALSFFSAITGLTAALGLLPIVGVIGTIVANNYIKTWLLTYIVMSWPITVIFWLSVGFSVILSVIVILLVASR